MISFITLIFGLLMLVGGGAMLVRGASEIAARLGVSPMFVGLTVVGFGTSAPELVVNSIGASQGATGLAFGNLIGSNISNMALVLGVAAVMSPITIQGLLVRREIPLLLLVTTIMTVMALDGYLEGRAPIIGTTDAIVLFLLFCIFLYTNVLDLIRSREDPLIIESEDYLLVVKATQRRLGWLFAVGGIVLLFIGGQLTVNSAVTLATVWGVSETVVGLFVVAIGTSAPELVTSVIAVARRESDLALGNVVGSNLFNSLIVLPTTALIEPIPVPQEGVSDLLLSWILVAVLIPIFFLGEAKLGRAMGIVLLLVYVSYAGWRVVSGGA